MPGIWMNGKSRKHTRTHVLIEKINFILRPSRNTKKEAITTFDCVNKLVFAALARNFPSRLVSMIAWMILCVHTSFAQVFSAAAAAKAAVAAAAAMVIARGTRCVYAIYISPAFGPLQRKAVKWANNHRHYANQRVSWVELSIEAPIIIIVTKIIII